ncbi:hypothetical protein Tco_0391010 [Tanacetum coccineum]
MDDNRTMAQLLEAPTEGYEDAIVVPEITADNFELKHVNRIDIIELACKEYSQEVLGFFDLIASGNPTPYYDPIVSTSSLTLTPFEDIVTPPKWVAAEYGLESVTS